MSDSDEIIEFVKKPSPVKDAVKKSLPALGMLAATTIFKILSSKK